MPGNATGAIVRSIRRILLAGLAAGAIWSCDFLRIRMPPAVVRAPAIRPLARATARTNVMVGTAVPLDGSASLRNPLEFWMADGDEAWEDRIVCYDDARGFRTIGPLRDPRGRASRNTYGWPSDLQLVDGVVYGIDTWRRRMFMLDAGAGIVHPLRQSRRWTAVRDLAYDPSTDMFYATDSRDDVLLRARRSDPPFGLRAGRFELVARLPLDEITGLVFDARSGRLIAYDAPTSRLYWIDQRSGRIERSVALPLAGPDADGDRLYDELAAYGTEIYGVYRWVDRNVSYAQMRRIDPETGATEDIGPIVPKISAHSLIVWSVPERVRWVVAQGDAGAVRIDAPDALETTARFTAPGDYVLRLTLQGAAGDATSDPIPIAVTAAPRTPPPQSAPRWPSK
jgi:hypothetical protein